jgi:hypothetical protein
VKLSILNKRYIKSIFITVPLSMLVLTITGCEDFGQFPTATPATETPKTEEVAPPTTISTADRAILTVYEHLLDQAESDEAKMYLAEFYTVSDNWSAEKERFKDGSIIWYVLVDMTAEEKWEQASHWQQASWFVFRDGRVIPSNRLSSNALRIEADLQKLSLTEEP